MRKVCTFSVIMWPTNIHEHYNSFSDEFLGTSMLVMTYPIRNTAFTDSHTTMNELLQFCKYCNLIIWVNSSTHYFCPAEESEEAKEMGPWQVMSMQQVTFVKFLLLAVYPSYFFTHTFTGFRTH